MSSDQYAGFWLRFVAYIIDYIIIQVLQSFVVLPILAAMGVGFATASQTIDWNNMGNTESIAVIGAAAAAFGTLALLSFAILSYTIV